MSSKAIETSKTQVTDEVEEKVGSLLSQALVISGWLKPDEDQVEPAHSEVSARGSKPVFHTASPSATS